VKKLILVMNLMFCLSFGSPALANNIETLIKELGRESKAKDASKDLAEIGKPAVPALIQALEGKNKYQKRYAARSIREMGQTGSDAIPALEKLLKDRDVPTREYAVEALGNMLLQAEHVLPMLKKATKDKNKDVAEKANRSIQKIQTALTDKKCLADIIKSRLNATGKRCTSLVLEEESPNQYKGVAEFEDGLKTQVVVKVSGSKVQHSFGGELKTNVEKADISSSESASKEVKETKSSESKAISQENEIILLMSKIKQLEETAQSQRQIIERLNGELAESRKKLADIAKNVQIVRVDDSTEKTKKSMYDSNPQVAGVMYSTLPGYEYTTIGRAFNTYFANPKWEFKVAENGAKSVEFSGRLKGLFSYWEKGDMVIVKFALSHNSKSFELWSIELPPKEVLYGLLSNGLNLRSSDWEDRETIEDLLNKIYAIQ